MNVSYPFRLPGNISTNTKYNTKPHRFALPLNTFVCGRALCIMSFILFYFYSKKTVKPNNPYNRSHDSRTNGSLQRIWLATTTNFPEHCWPLFLLIFYMCVTYYMIYEITIFTEGKKLKKKKSEEILSMPY